MTNDKIIWIVRNIFPSGYSLNVHLFSISVHVVHMYRGLVTLGPKTRRLSRERPFVPMDWLLPALFLGVAGRFLKECWSNPNLCTSNPNSCWNNPKKSWDYSNSSWDYSNRSWDYSNMSWDYWNRSWDYWNRIWDYSNRSWDYWTVSWDYSNRSWNYPTRNWDYWH